MLESSCYQVSAAGFSGKEKIMLKAMVNLAPAGSRLRWRFVEHPPAPVMMVNIDDPVGRALLANPPRAMLITVGSDPSYRNIFPHLSPPLDNKELRAILELCARQLSS